MHIPKKIVMTHREGSEIIASLWAEESSRHQEREAHDLARHEGWMMHAFRVGDQSAMYTAVERHQDIERHHHIWKAKALNITGPTLIRVA
ncbi:MAG: hypothetical protein ACYS7Y_04020 [Planctomycetota bacterium]|jgi:hypothetical protein